MHGQIRRTGLVLSAVGCTCAAGVLGFTSAGLAQHLNTQPRGIESPNVQQDSRPDVTLEFKGGTVQEYVDLLRASTKLPVNVMMSPEVSRVRLGPVRLERCPLWIAVGTIEYSTEDASMTDRISVSPINDVAGGPPLNFAVKFKGPPAQMARNIAGPMGYVDPTLTDLVGTYSISQIVNAPVDLPNARTLTIEQVTQALDAVLRLTPAGKQPPSILVHKETGLLVVQGSAEQLNLAKGVIGQLKDDLETGRKRAAADIRAAESREQQLVQEREVRARLEQERDMLVARLQSAQKRQSALLKDNTDSPNRAMELNDLQAEIQITRGEISQIEARLREARIGSFGGRAQSEDVDALKREVAELRDQLQELKDSRSKK